MTTEEVELGEALAEATAAFQLTRNPELLDAAARRWFSAVAPPRPRPSLPVREKAARLFRLRYEVRGEAKDLDRCISLCTQVRAAYPDDESVPAEQLADVAFALGERFRRDGELSDIDRGIEALEVAVRRSIDPAASEVWHARLAAYRVERSQASHRESVADAALARASEMRHEYFATHEADTLDELVRLLDRAVDQTRGGGEVGGSRARLFEGLARALFHRHSARGRWTDLDRCIDAAREGLRETASIDLGAHALEGLLAAGLARRHQRTGKRVDLAEAIRLREQLAAAFWPTDEERVAARVSLAATLGDWYDATAETAELDRAARLVAEEHTGLTRGGDVWRFCISTRAHVWWVQAAARRDSQLLDAAISACHELLIEDSTPEDTAHSQYMLGAMLALRHDLLGEPSDAQSAATNFRSSCRTALVLEPASALITGLDWGNWAARHSAWSEAVEAFEIAAQARDLLLVTQATRWQRESWLRAARELPARSAVAYWRAGDVAGGVSSLERGLAILLAERLEQDRRALVRLAAAGHEELARRFIELAGQSYAGRDGNQWSGTNLVRADPTSGQGSRAEEREAARRELQAVAAEIRRLEGFGEFGGEPGADLPSLSEPLVYLVAIEETAAAFVCHASDGSSRQRVDAVELPQLDTGVIRSWMQRVADADVSEQGDTTWHDALDALTKWLWQAVMEPVLGAVPAGPLTVVPTGALALLPLHAAWTPDPAFPTGRRYVLDTHTLTYVPSASARSAARSSARRFGESLSLFAVADPQPSRTPALRFSIGEAAVVSRHFEHHDLRVGPDVTVERVLRSLSQYDVVHLACHGRSNMLSPLDSGILLAGDRMLTLRELYEETDSRQIRMRLVVLSACETSLPGAELPDEMLSLSTGFLSAGAAGAVASLWRVSDAATALLMIKFVADWRDSGQQGERPQPAEALAQACKWVRDTTNRAKAAYLSRFLTAEASLGLPTQSVLELWKILRQRPEHRDFAHPTFWAGFVHVGA